MIDLTKVEENTDFNILESQMEAYKKWGYIAGFKNEDTIILESEICEDSSST